MEINKEIKFNDYYCSSTSLLEALQYLTEKYKELLFIKSEISKNDFLAVDLFLQLGMHAVQTILLENRTDIKQPFVEIKNYVLQKIMETEKAAIYLPKAIKYFETDWEKYTDVVITLNKTSNQYDTYKQCQLANMHTMFCLQNLLNKQ